LNKSYFYAVLTMVFFSCTSDRLDVHIDTSQTDIPLLRMEQDLPQELVSIEQTKAINSELLQKYGLLYELFVGRMIQEGSVNDPMIGDYLFKRFNTDALMKEVLPELDTAFGDFSRYEKEIEGALSYCQYYFPDSAMPDKIVTFFSYFNAHAMVVDNSLCVGVEMYLGNDHESVRKLPAMDFPQFFKNKMDKKYLTANTVKAWLLENYYACRGEDFLDKIIAAGKIMYLMDAVMPDKDSGIKMAYSSNEIEWAQANENKVWQYMIEQDVLYSKDEMLEANWITDGPFTKGLSDESPARMGIWMGWQIVKDYMNANREVTLTQMVNEPNSKRILKYYDPKG